MTLWRVRATVDDRPGFLAVLTASLALRSINILSVQVHATESGAVDDFLVDAPAELTEPELLAAVVRGRGRDPWVGRTEAHYLVDPPTEALAAATRVVRDPDDLPDALAALLRAGVTQTDEAWVGFRPGLGAGGIDLPDPAGGALRITRDAPPFTPAEYARARALVDLAAQARRGDGVRWRVALPGGDEIDIRPATEADAGAIAAMHARCSPGTLRSRFLGARPLVRLTPEPAATLVATAAGGLVVATGVVAFDGAEAEMAVLVEDAAQRRGVGTALVRRLREIATEVGADVLHAHTYRENSAMVRTIDRLGVPVTRTSDGPLLTLSADLRADRDGDRADASGEPAGGL
jgi:GNAT superfamily N-acetyltransferase